MDAGTLVGLIVCARPANCLDALDRLVHLFLGFRSTLNFTLHAVSSRLFPAARVSTAEDSNVRFERSVILTDCSYGEIFEHGFQARIRTLVQVSRVQFLAEAMVAAASNASARREVECCVNSEMLIFDAF